MGSVGQDRAQQDGLSLLLRVKDLHWEDARAGVICWLGAEIIWKPLYSHGWCLCWEDLETRIGNWTAYRWLLHVVVQSGLTWSQNGNFRTIGFLTWHLKAPSVTDPANEVIVTPSYVTKPWKPYSLTSTMFDCSSSPKPTQIQGEEN